MLAVCGENQAPGPTAELPVGREDLPGTPDQVVENGEHVITDEGVRKAKLVAEQLYFFNQPAKVYGDTIQVTFFDDQGEFVSILTASTGELDQTSQIMVARENVFVRGRDSTIESEEIHYDPRSDRIWSEVPTVINQRGNVIRGRGVETDPAMREIRITGGSAVLRSEPDVDGRPSTPPAAGENPEAEAAEPVDDERPDGEQEPEVEAPPGDEAAPPDSP